MLPKNDKDIRGRALEIEEIRLICDLRVMHSKVDELYQLVKVMMERHDEPSIVSYADRPVLDGDIQKVDEIYMWFVRLREEVDARTRRQRAQ